MTVSLDILREFGRCLCQPLSFGLTQDDPRRHCPSKATPNFSFSLSTLSLISFLHACPSRAIMSKSVHETYELCSEDTHSSYEILESVGTIAASSLLTASSRRLYFDFGLRIAPGSIIAVVKVARCPFCFQCSTLRGADSTGAYQIGIHSAGKCIQLVQELLGCALAFGECE